MAFSPALQTFVTNIRNFVAFNRSMTTVALSQGSLNVLTLGYMSIHSIYTTHQFLLTDTSEWHALEGIINMHIMQHAKVHPFLGHQSLLLPHVVPAPTTATSAIESPRFHLSHQVVPQLPTPACVEPVVGSPTIDVVSTSPVEVYEIDPQTTKEDEFQSPLLLRTVPGDLNNNRLSLSPGPLIIDTPPLFKVPSDVRIVPRVPAFKLPTNLKSNPTGLQDQPMDLTCKMELIKDPGASMVVKIKPKTTRVRARTPRKKKVVTVKIPRGTKRQQYSLKPGSPMPILQSLFRERLQREEIPIDRDLDRRTQRVIDQVVGKIQITPDLY